MKLKGKKVGFTLEQTMKAQRESKNVALSFFLSFFLSLTSALDGGGWLTPRFAALPPRMTRYPLCSKLGGPQGRSGRE